MRGIVAAEVLDECRYLSLKLDVEGLDDVETAIVGLSTDNPVDICIVIHTYANWRRRVNIAINLRGHGFQYVGVTHREVTFESLVNVGRQAPA